MPEKPTPKVNVFEQSLLDAHSKREQLPKITAPGKASSLDFEEMSNTLGEAFQLHKGEKYLVDSYVNKKEKQAYLEAKQKADEQGFWGEMVGFVAQAGLGEIVLGTIEGIGYLLDFDHWADKASGGEGDWGNWLSTLAKKGKEGVAEMAPIYVDPDGKERGFWDNLMHTDGWWASNGVSVASTLSIMIPVAGWARGVSMIGKGAKLLSKTATGTAKMGSQGAKAVKAVNLADDVIEKFPSAFNRFINRSGDAVHKAIVSRHIENHMEAAGVYQEQYDRFIAEGMSEEEAKTSASKGAAFTYKANWPLVLLDIPQYLMIGRGFKASREFLNFKTAKAAGQSVTKTAALNLKSYAAQFASEGFEEAYQFVVGEEGKYLSDHHAGVKNEQSGNFSERLKDYTNDSELWTSAFFGGFGGAVFQATGGPINSFVQKKLLKKGEKWLNNEDLRLQELKNRFQVLSSNAKVYHDAVNAGDERAVNAAKQRIGYDLGVNAAKMGNMSTLKGSLETLKNAGPEEKAKYGFGDDFNENVDEWLASAERAADLYEKNMNSGKFEESTVDMITYREHTIDHYSRKLPVLRKEVETLKQDIPLINELSVNGKAAFETKAAIKSAERYIAAAKWSLENVDRPAEGKETLTNSITAYEELIVEEKLKLDETINKGLTKLEKITLNSLEGGATDNLIKAQAETIWMENTIADFSEDLVKLTGASFQKEVRKHEDEQVEKLSTEKTSSKKKEKIKEDRDELNNAVSDTEKGEARVTAKVDPNVDAARLSEQEESGAKLWDDFSTEEKQIITNYRNEIAATTSEQDDSTPGKRNPTADHQKQEANAVAHTEVSTPENGKTNEDFIFGDDEAQEITSTFAAKMAFLSSNNPIPNKPLAGQNPENKALTAYLEGNHSLEGVEFYFELDTKYLEVSAKEGNRFNRPNKDDIDLGIAPRFPGELPIKAKMFKDGKPVVYAGHELSMFLHNGEWKGHKTLEQKQALIDFKSEIYEALKAGKTIKTKYTGKSNGNININRDLQGAFINSSLNEVFGKTEDISLVYGDAQHGYIDAAGIPQEGLLHLTSSVPGALYAVTETANGSAFPARLQVATMSLSESALIHNIYADILADETAYNKPINDKTANKIKQSEDPRIKGLVDYLALSTITNKELLGHLVFEGRKTESSNEGRLLTYPANKEKGTPAVVAFGTQGKMDFKNLTSPEGKTAFMQHLQTHRRRQIDVKKINDPKYKEYLISNNILTSNAKRTPSGSLFIQPTVSFSGKFEATAKVTKSAVEKVNEAKQAELTSTKLPFNLESGMLTYADAVAKNYHLDAALFAEKTLLKADNIDVIIAEIKEIEEKYDAKLIEAKKEETPKAVEKPSAPKNTKTGGVEIVTPAKKDVNTQEDVIENDITELNLFSVIPDEDIKNTADENKDQVAEYKADEAADAKKKARAARLAEAKKKRDEGNTGAFKRFKPAEGTHDFLNIADEAAHIRRLLPAEIAVRVTPGYLRVLAQGNVAIGLFENGMIALSSKATKGTGYHEAFHAVFRTLLTTKQQLNILAEAQKYFEKPTAKDLSNLMEDHDMSIEAAEKLFYEELLADEFGAYMTNPKFAVFNNKYPTGVKGLFQKLLDWIQNVFTSKSTTKKLFNDINRGKFRTKTPKIERVVRFKQHPLFSADQVQEVTHQLAYAALHKVTELENIKDNFDWDAVRDTLINAQLAAEELGTEIGDNIANKIDALFDDNDNLDQFWIDSIDKFVKVNFDVKEARQATDDEDMQDAKDGGGFVKKSYEVSSHDSATKNTKFIVAMVPIIEGYNEEGKPVYAKSSLLGLPLFNDVSTVFNTLQRSLTGVVSVSKGGVIQDPLALMTAALQKEFKYKPELKFILDRLSSMSEAVQTQFFTTFSQQKGNYLTHLLEGTPGNLVSRITSENLNEKEQTLLNGWASTFVDNLGTFAADGKTMIYDTNAIKVFSNLRAEFIGLVTEDLRDKDVTEQTAISGATKRAFLNSLSQMGVTLTSKAFDKLIDIYTPNGAKGVNGKQQAISLLRKDFINATNDLLNKVGNLNDNTNLLSNEKSFFRDKLATVQADFTNLTGEDSFIGAGGRAYYKYQANSPTSKAIAAINSGDLTYLQELAKSDYNTNSIWLKALLHPTEGAENRRKFKLALYGNLKEVGTADRGAKASELKPADQFIDVFNKYLGGVFVGLAEADKGEQNYFQGMPVQRTSVSYVESQDTVVFNNAMPNEVLIMKNYLADELLRMETARRVIYGYTDSITGEQIAAGKEEDLILHYHYHLVKEGEGSFGEKMDKIPGSALESFLFPNIDLLGLNLKDSETGEIYPLTGKGFDTNPELIDYLKTALANAIKRDIDKSLEYGLINRSGTGFKNVGISITHLEERGGDIVAAIADFTLNSIIANVEQTKLFNGDPAFYKVKPAASWKDTNHFADFMKRIPMAFVTGTDIRIFNNPDGTPAVKTHYSSATVDNIDGVGSSFFADEDGKFNEANFDIMATNTGLSKSALKKLLKNYLDVNQTDAQAWISLPAYKERMRGYGKWTEAHDVAYEKAILEQPLGIGELALLAQPLKTVHAELKLMGNNISVPHYNKQSEAVLLPFMTKNTKLDNLRVAMEQQGVDHVIVLDGKKVGASGITKMADAKGDILNANDIKLNKVFLKYNNLFLQQDLTAHGVEPRLVGTQGTKNVLAVVTEGELYTEDQVIARELVDDFHSTISKLSDKALVTFKDKIGYNTTTNTLESDETGRPLYYNAIQEEFLGEISDNHMEALNANVALDALPIKDKIQNKGNALLTKTTVKMKQLGGAFIQMSDFGFVGSEVDLTKEVKDNIIWFKDPKEKLKPMHMDETGVKKAQILLPYARLVKDLEKVLNTGKAEEDRIDIQSLSHNEIKALIGEGVLEGITYRIPNQGPGSNDAVEIVGILPAQMGDTMIAFAGITTKTGSDFDIDKSFIVLPNYSKNKKTGKIEKIIYDKTKANPTKLELENHRLDLMMAMLTHPKSYAPVMTPLDDPWFKDLATELYPEISKKGDLGYFQGATQMEIKAIFDQAKNLVGTIANHTTHYSLALSEDLYFKDYYLGKGIKTSEKGNSALSNKFDEDGNPIEVTLGAFMNAIVDAAKDPFISRANINQLTANTTFMLARAGVSREWIVAFMGQPILKEYVRQISLAEGRFVKNDTDTTPLDNTLSAFGIDATPYELYNEMSMSMTDDNITTTTEQLSATLAEVNKAQLAGEEVIVDGNTQAQILAQFLQWQKKAKALNDVVKVSKADVNGATKNLTQAKLADNLLTKVIQDNEIGNVDKLIGYDIVDGEAVFNGTRMTGTYHKNSVRAAREIFQGLYLSTTEAFEASLDNIAADAGYQFLVPGETHEALAGKINKELYSMVASHTTALEMTSEELHAMLFGRKGDMKGGKFNIHLDIAQRLNKAKTEEQSKDNLLVKSLQTKPSYGTSPANVYLPNNESTKLVKDQLYTAWVELETILPDLANDLIKYSFYSTGFSVAPGYFYDHIPMTKLEESGFSDEIKGHMNALSDITSLQEHEDKVFKNLHRDNTLVPTVPDKLFTAEVGQEAYAALLQPTNGNTFGKAVGFLLTEGAGKSYIAGVDKDGNPAFKRFVKVSKPVFNHRREFIRLDYNLYQLQGYTEEGNAMYIRTNKLGYDYKGNTTKEYIGDGNSSIFPENNVSLPSDINEFLKGVLLAPISIPVGEYDANKFKRVDNNDNNDEQQRYCSNIK